MSAIFGRFDRRGQPIPPTTTEAAADCIGLGQLGSCVACHNDSVVLGQYIRPEQPETQNNWQRVADDLGQLAVCADVVLDNRLSLGRSLGLAPEQLAALPDRHLIGLAYRRWGIHCPDYLLGDFAFAIWDEARAQLFCARDHVGARPFYYHLSDEFMAFASDIECLLAFPDVPRQLDLSYVRSHLQIFHFYNKEATFFAHIRKLPPGYTLLITSDSVQLARWWQPEHIDQTRYRHVDDYSGHLLSLIEQAVASASATEARIGAHMSGGLDSTTVAVLTARQQRQSPEPLVGFSWSPTPRLADFPLADERGAIEEIALREGIELRYCDLQPADLVRSWTRDMTTQPTETLQWELAVGRDAQQLGVGVILSGWGGDEVAAFNGRGYFADLFKRGAWRTLQRELRLQANLQGDSLWNGFRNRAILPLIPDALLRRLRPQSPQLLRPEPFPIYLQPDFAEELRRAPLLPRPSEREVAGVRANQLDLLAGGHLAHRMDSWAAIGRRRGITYRYPLLDRRVVEFCLSVPDHLYFRDGWKRFLFRKAVEDLLPPDVVWNKRKSDPAMTRHVNSLRVEADRLLVDELLAAGDRGNRDRFVRIDDVIAGLASSHTVEASDNPRYVDAHRALWLLFLRDDVLV